MMASTMISFRGANGFRENRPHVADRIGQPAPGLLHPKAVLSLPAASAGPPDLRGIRAGRRGSFRGELRHTMASTTLQPIPRAPRNKIPQSCTGLLTRYILPNSAFGNMVRCADKIVSTPLQPEPRGKLARDGSFPHSLLRSVKFSHNQTLY